MVIQEQNLDNNKKNLTRHYKCPGLSRYSLTKAKIMKHFERKLVCVNPESFVRGDQL